MFEILGGNISSPIGANRAPALPIDILAARALPIDAAVPPKYDLHYFCWGVFAEHDHLTEGPLRSLGPALKHALALLIVLRRLTSFADTRTSRWSRRRRACRTNRRPRSRRR